MTTVDHQLKPFKVEVPDSVLDDLRQRLENTRWASDLNNEDMKYGVSTEYVKGLVDYWLDGFDWRAREREMNAYDQFKVEVDGNPVHFIYEKGKGPNPTPLILLHGWPWTYWDYTKMIGPLTDPASHGGDPEESFDVIIPSLLGFGFSSPLTDGEMTAWKQADVFQKLMTEVLGYEKYAASGTDHGAHIVGQLGHKYADSLIATQLGHDLILEFFVSERPWDVTEGNMIPADATPEVRAAIVKFQETYVSHVAVHMLDAQTLTLGLNDSPVGMLAWILQRWMKWSDQSQDFETVFPRDHILIKAMIYWVSESIGTSIRAYKNLNLYPWAPSHDRKPQIEAPVGFTFLVGDAYPPGATIENRVELFRGGDDEAFNGRSAEWFNTVYAKAHEPGGHFGPWENPDAYIEDIREIVRIVEAS